MPFHQLPRELLYAIVSHLGADEDYPSLHACASTCRALVLPAQTHIFRTITLFYEDPTVLTVLSKLESTPHIRTFVKHLRLFETHKPWIQHSELLHRTLALLSPYIISLHIHQRRRKPENPRFRLSSLSQLKYVENISLCEEVVAVLAGLMYGDDALPIFLNQFLNLRAITFDWCLVRNQIIDNNDITPPVFRLERLDVGSCRDTLVLDWLVPALSSLQTLHLSYPALCPSFFSTIVPRFMTTAGESLQHLELRGLNDASNADLLSLMTAVRTHATNLRSLSLMNTNTISISEQSPIQVAVQSLLLINTHAHLQRLTIGFNQDDYPVDDSPWDDLQDILLGIHSCFY